MRAQVSFRRALRAGNIGWWSTGRMGEAVRLAGYRLRRTVRGRWGGYAAVVLLVGLVGGLAIGAVAGARRTQSTYSAFLVRSGASDLQVQVYSSRGQGSILSQLYSPALT